MGLSQFLKRAEGARKIFGKRELKIIEKQLWGVRLTQSERNRLSRDIRKKFAFIKEVSRFSDEFPLKKGVEVGKLVEEARRVLLESKYFPRIKRIFLFGSATDGFLTLFSDIDIAVELDSVSNEEATQLRIEMLRNVNEKMDIQVYNVLPEKIKKEIDSKGRVLYERSHSR